jgi:endo-alpha-1,4-polygalactosaminidase (GH114 family)
MIDRRSFLIGLGLSALPAAARADYTINGGTIATDRSFLANVPYVRFEDIPSHRQLMRDNVVGLAGYAKARQQGFAVLVRDAPELLITGQREIDLDAGRGGAGAVAGKPRRVGEVDAPYLGAIDGLLVDGLAFGRDAPDRPAPPAAADPLAAAEAAVKKAGKTVLAIDYAKDARNAAEAARKCAAAHALSFIDQSGNRTLAHLPKGVPPGENASHVTSLKEARNFLPMLSAGAFASQDAWVDALCDSNWDLLIIDPLWQGAQPLSTEAIHRLQQKRLGSRRQVFAVMSLGRADPRRFYWKSDWKVGSPAWLDSADPTAPTQVVVRYWEQAWKEILGKYLQGLMDLGVDGVLLDHADTYSYFEALTPLK